MPTAPVIIRLPTADRRIAFDFYSEGLGFASIGELAEDGVPEPLQFVLGEQVRLMLIPRGGFGWISGDRGPADRGVSECVLSVSASSEAGVDEMLARATVAGGEDGAGSPGMGVRRCVRRS